MRDPRDGEKSANEQDLRSGGHPPTAFPPAGSQAWEQSWALQPTSPGPGIQPSFQSVGHLITYRRCEFPEAPLCGLLLKVCFPTPVSGSPLKGLTDGSSFPTPPAGQAHGAEGVFWEQTGEEELGE